MKAIILAVLLVGSVGWGQQHVVLYSPENATEHGTPKYPQPAPLKCGGGEFPGNEFGPYVHGEKTPVTKCYSDLTGKAVDAAPLKCGKWERPNPVSDNPPCLDELHVVTEREWQELMERLKKLEKKTSGMCPDPDMACFK